MDEHSSRAGIITRIEAFLEHIGQDRQAAGKPSQGTRAIEDPNARTGMPAGTEHPEKPIGRSARAEVLFLPYLADHAYGFAAAARFVGIDARVLAPPDEESERLGRPHMVGGECHPFALVMGDYLKLAQSERPERAERSLFYFLGSQACRLEQYPVYMEKIRRELGCSIGIVSDVSRGLAAFGVSPACSRRALLRAWEGLNAYDLLMRLHCEIRPVAEDRAVLDQIYAEARQKLFHALSSGRTREGMEEALNDLYHVPVKDVSGRPVVAVTGDYYTRVIPFANNDVYAEIERLGGVLWSPPTFSDAYKIGTLREFIWTLLSGRSREAAQDGLLYLLMAASEFKVKGGPTGRRTLNSPLDLLGRRMWKSAARHADTRLPGGITAPIVTVLQHLDMGADGALNLITLNCSYGTVVTAALSRALKARPGIPMLTLVYDGLKKTNEKTRLEAFMEQVRDHWRKKGV